MPPSGFAPPSGSIEPTPLSGFMPPDGSTYVSLDGSTYVSLEDEVYRPLAVHDLVLLLELAQRRLQL